MVFLLPAVLMSLLAGGLNLLSFIQLKNDHLADRAEHSQDYREIALTRTFNQDVGAIQNRVSDLLTEASTGKVDEAEVYLVHSQIVNQLAALDQRLPELREAIGDKEQREISLNFQDYRNAIVQATDLAAIDPTQAMSQAYLAAQSYLRISLLSRAIATSVGDRSEQRSKEREERFGARTLQNAVVGGILVLVLMAIWVYMILRLTGRLSTLTSALDELSQGSVNPQALPDVRRMADQRRSLLSDLSHAVLAFRETSLANRKAQYDLGERMKELSCLFDIQKHTTVDDIDMTSMFEFVAARLAPAMRFPEIAVGRIECANKIYGTYSDGEALSASFIGIKGQACRVIVVYNSTLPTDAGAPFLPEEESLLEAIATYLSGALERKRIMTAEKAAAAEIRKLSLVIEQSPNSVVITDLDSHIEYVNEAFIRNTGYSRDEVLGKKPLMFKSGKTPAATYQSMWQALTSGAMWAGEFINLNRQGQEQIEAAIIVPLKQPDGQITHYVAIKEDITAKREQENQLRKLFLAVEQSPESIVITDLKATIEYVNEAFQRNTGYTRAEAIGLNPRVLQSGQTPKAVYKEMWAALSRGEIWRGELFNRRKDGSEYVEFANISPIRQPNGEVTHFLAIKEDVTEKKALMDELQRHREHLEQLIESRTAELNTAMREQDALFDAATVGIVLLQNRVILRCNRTLDEMLGYEIGEQLGQSVRIWFPDDETYEKIGQEVYALVNRGQMHLAEEELVRKDGSRFYVRMSGRAIDKSDPSKGMVGIVEDITAQRAASEALRLVNGEQQAIFDTATSGISLITDRILTRCNHRLHEMFGWPIGEMVGKPTAIWYPDQAANAAAEVVYEKIWRGEVSCLDQELIRRDGSRFWARLTGTAVDINDHSKGTVWVIDDITAERAAIEQMQHAKTLAEAAARMKSDFLANMSHEIRTPMNAIIGMSHLAMKTELTPRQRDYLKKIDGASQHLLGIINDILDLSKIEAGKMTVEHVAFDLNQVFDNVAGLIAEKTATKGLELIFDVANEVPTDLIGDPLRLGQVLINFASNAVKFTERGEIAIRVTLERESEGALTLKFSVRDTGIGLTAAQQSQLFQSFQQADTSTTRKYGGTGLGLAISRQLATLMGGQVGVESEPGIGSTFWFTARVKRGEVIERKLLPEPDLRGRRVLVVDDNDHAREIIAEQLRSMTFVVNSLSSGTQAVAEVSRADRAGVPYEIVFLDWQMPDMDGIATAGEIRALALANQPHLLMITAYGREEVMISAKAVGIEDLLVKPVNPSLLFDSVMRTLGSSDREQMRYLESAPVTLDLSAIKGARLLLVEDNELNQYVATELLQHAGFVVEVAENGAIALTKIQQSVEPYALVLMDMQMPVMDGLSATREIRKLPQTSDLPIVAMTANAMIEDRDRCLEAGMNDHLAKPIDPDQLWSALAKWIKPKAAVTAAVLVSPSGSKAPSTLPALSPVAGLNMKQGLHYALGRQELYVSLLKKFVLGQKDFPKRLAASLAQMDWQTAERLAHTLKGLSAQIGATELHHQAEGLELAIRQRKDIETFTPLQLAVSNQLEKLLDSITATLPPEETMTQGAKVDTVQLQELCIQLAAQLSSDDFASSQTFDAHAELFHAALGERFAPVADAIYSFNFATALDLMEKAIAAHGIRLS